VHITNRYVPWKFANGAESSGFAGAEVSLDVSAANSQAGQAQALADFITFSVRVRVTLRLTISQSVCLGLYLPCL
jgi:hypothetical protein